MIQALEWQKKKERKVEKNYSGWRDGLGLKVCDALAEVMSSILAGTRLHLQLFWSLWVSALVRTHSLSRKS